MADLNQRAEEIIARWLDYNNHWATPDDPHLFDRSYVVDFRAFSHYLDPDDVVDEDTDQAVVIVHVAVDDELGHAILMGIYDDARLVYCTAEIDTAWRDFWAADFPTGWLSMTKPYNREGKFLNTREEVN